MKLRNQPRVHVCTWWISIVHRYILRMSPRPYWRLDGLEASQPSVPASISHRGSMCDNWQIKGGAISRCSQSKSFAFDKTYRHSKIAISQDLHIGLIGVRLIRNQCPRPTAVVRFGKAPSTELNESIRYPACAEISCGPIVAGLFEACRKSEFR